MTSRLERCRNEMKARNLRSLLVTHIENVRYLSGFSGSFGCCLVQEEGGIFLTDGRYFLQAPQEVQELEVRFDVAGAPSSLPSLLKSAPGPVGFEGEHVSVNQYQGWRELADSAVPDQSLVPTSGLVEGLRMLKDESELALIRAAVEIVDRTFQEVIGSIRPGLTEKALAMEIDDRMRRCGAEKSGFDTIVATGPHSAWPHARPTDRPIASGDLLTMDFGAVLRGYNSDITRTVVVGSATEKQKKVYDAVLSAQLKALAAIRPGRQGKEIDAVARQCIAEAGFGEFFIHNLGHSLGRSVHDGAAFHPKADQLLQPGMVLTVEPGIYIEGFGGVRIEDDILVTPAGCDILTQSSKELLFL